MSPRTLIGKYLLRRVDPRDGPLVDLWIEQDPYHRGHVKPEFFLVNKTDKECFAVEDRHGLVIFYVSMTMLESRSVIVLDVQFSPLNQIRTKKWVAEALMDGMTWLKQAAEGAGVKEIRFNSIQPSLVGFAQERLGFRRDGEWLRLYIPPLHTTQGAEKAPLQ